MSLDDWRTGWQIAQVLVMVTSICVNVILYRATRSERLAKAINDGDRAVRTELTKFKVAQQRINTTHHTRLTVAEGQLRTLPTHDDLNAIKDQLADVATNVAALAERSSNTNAMVSMIHAHLLEQGNG